MSDDCPSWSYISIWDVDHSSNLKTYIFSIFFSSFNQHQKKERKTTKNYQYLISFNELLTQLLLDIKQVSSCWLLCPMSIMYCLVHYYYCQRVMILPWVSLLSITILNERPTLIPLYLFLSQVFRLVGYHAAIESSNSIADLSAVECQSPRLLYLSQSILQHLWHHCGGYLVDYYLRHWE